MVFRAKPRRTAYIPGLHQITCFPTAIGLAASNFASDFRPIDLTRSLKIERSGPIGQVQSWKCAVLVSLRRGPPCWMRSSRPVSPQAEPALMPAALLEAGP